MKPITKAMAVSPSIDDSLTPYIEDVAGKVSPKKLKVAVDPGNGTAGLFVDALMSAWGQDAVTINMELDGSFPNHAPDPSKAKNLAAIDYAAQRK